MLKRVLVGATVAGAGWLVYNRISRWAATWGVDDEIARRALPGDDLVPVPTKAETRSIEIDAPPEAVWPWLVQMGYGRGGWYSYDQLDMQGRSAERILPEHQSLAVGDTVPTHPGGGFVVRVLDPARALVLIVNPGVMATWSEAPEDAIDPRATPGLAASGALMSGGMPPDFEASWAFVLEPLAGERTRLIERFRVAMGTATPGSRLLGPMMGFGVFVMMRRQMVGIRDRAEAFGRVPVPPVPAMDPTRAVMANP